MSEVACRDITKLDQMVQVAYNSFVQTMGDKKFIVVETLRSYNRQSEMFKTGKSKTIHSRHLTGHAFDIMPKNGYDAWGTDDWNHAHDVWDTICIGLGGKPEPRIGWDMGHFGML